MMDIQALKKAFVEIYGGDEAGLRVFCSPGRVNLIGEHVDYNGGYVFPMALTLSTVVVARRRSDSLVRLAATDLPDRVTLDTANIDAYKSLPWGNYQAGAISELQKAGYSIAGLDLLYHDTVPHGGGLSSSAAIEVCTALVFATYSNEGKGIRKPVDMVEMALLAQRAENKYVGVNCGIMDQFASAMGKRDHALLLNCNTLSYEHVPLVLGEHTIVIANTNKKRSLMDSKYNERRAECDEALSQLQKALPETKCLCEITPEQFKKHEGLISSPVVRKRAEHAIFDNARVFEAVKALRAGDLAAFGKLLTQAHYSLRDLYEVTGRELDALVEAALKVEGVLGSRMTGAGFGGCTVSIVRRDCVEGFIASVGEEYRRETGLEPEFYLSDAGDGGRELE